MFVRSGFSWTRQARLELRGVVQAAAIDGDRLILVQLHTEFAIAYRRDNGVWTRQATLTPDVNSAPFFNVSMSGGRAVLGAPVRSPFGDVFAGSAYVYRLKAVAGQRDVWIRETGLHPPATADHADPFGGSLDVSRNRIVVGSPGEHSGGGRAYVFARGSDGRWRQTDLLHAFGPLETTARCNYGASVAIHYDRIATLSPCTRSVDLSHRESGAETWIRRDRIVTGKIFGTIELFDCGAFVGVQGFSDGSGDAVYVLPSATCAPPITP